MHNFGRNLEFRPEYHESPASEAEVLDLLRRHRGRHFRAHASLHSWSNVAVTDEVSVDVSRLAAVQIDATGDFPTATVGAGCTIQKLVDELNRHDWATPSLGLITAQTIAGATSTATHGSGRHCLSHYIRRIRIATYNAAGEPVIHEIGEGPDLEAARCALGNLGIITSITLEIRPQYRVEELFQKYATLNDVLAAEPEYPLQQFYLVPWNWSYFAQHRRESKRPRSRTATLYRWFWSLGMDRGLHWMVIAMARWLPDVCTPALFRWLLPLLVPRGWRVVDRSDRQLTMQHQLFRHIETELFVRCAHLGPMLELARWLLEWSAGESSVPRAEWEAASKALGIRDQLQNLQGKYRHHYIICVRKILPDHGLLTMSGGGGTEPWYSVSFISYARPNQRDGFFRFAEILILLSGQLFGARPHWGKYGPLPPPAVLSLYSALGEFLRLRKEIDPTEAFLAPWMKEVADALPGGAAGATPSPRPDATG